MSSTTKRAQGIFQFEGLLNIHLYIQQKFKQDIISQLRTGKSFGKFLVSRASPEVLRLPFLMGGTDFRVKNRKKN